VLELDYEIEKEKIGSNVLEKDKEERLCTCGCEDKENFFFYEKPILSYFRNLNLTF